MNKLVILQSSDIHGNIFPTDYVTDRTWGLACLSTIIKEQRNLYDHSLLIDTGDIIQGSPLAFYYHQNNQANYNPFIDCLNKCNYDVMTLGNHEFNYGLDYLTTAVNTFNNNLLCANIKGLPFDTKPYEIYTYGELKVAVLGLTTTHIPHWEQAEHITGLEFIDPITCYASYEQELTDQADIIIVNYHGGLENDPNDNATPTERKTGENVGSQLLNTFSSINVLLTGHQHRSIISQTNDQVVTQPSSNGQSISKIVIDIDTKKVDSVELLAVTDTTIADKDIIDTYQPLNDQANKYFDQVIAKLNCDLKISDIKDARFTGHPLLNFLNQVQLDVMGADISAVSLFDSAVGFSKDITIRQVLMNYPFPNTLVKLEMTGFDIKEALEISNNYFIINDHDEIDINPDYIYPKLQHFNFDTFGGITYDVDVSMPVGNRVSNILFNNKPFELDKMYSVVINNYRANNVDAYPIYEGQKIIKESDLDMITILIDYLLDKKEITVDQTPSFTLKK